MVLFMKISNLYLLKGLVYLALADPQEFFKKPLIKNEEQPSF